MCLSEVINLKSYAENEGLGADINDIIKHRSSCDECYEILCVAKQSIREDLFSSYFASVGWIEGIKYSQAQCKKNLPVFIKRFIHELEEMKEDLYADVKDMTKQAEQFDSFQNIADAQKYAKVYRLS